MILPEKSSGISLSCQTLRRSPSCPLAAEAPHAVSVPFTSPHCQTIPVPFLHPKRAHPMANSTETRSQITIPPLALPKSGTVEDLSSSQPVAQAPALMIFISVCKHNTEPLSCQQQKSPRKVRITVTNSAQGKASHTPFIPIYCPAFPVFFPSCQNATALAAATFRESTP